MEGDWWQIRKEERQKNYKNILSGGNSLIGYVVS